MGHRNARLCRLRVGRGGSSDASLSQTRKAKMLRIIASKWLPVTGLVAAWLTNPCRAAGVLDPRGPVAAAERLILLNATAIMLVVVVPVIVLTLGFAWWYRSSNLRATYSPDWSYSGRIEL